jgi:hypothetical protein
MTKIKCRRAIKILSRWCPKQKNLVFIDGGINYIDVLLKRGRRNMEAIIESAHEILAISSLPN